MLNYRKDIVNPGPPTGLISKLLHYRRAVRIFLAIAVGLGISAANLLFSSKPSDVDTGKALREASLYMFLGVTCLLALQTVILLRAEQAAGLSHPFNLPLLMSRHLKPIYLQM